MYKSSFLIVIGLAVLISCNNHKSEPSEKNIETAQNNVKEPEQPSVSKKFNWDNVPVTEASIGAFPYFSAPESYRYEGEKTRDFEEKYFFFNDSLVQQASGKYYHTKVYPAGNTSFSETFIVNSYKKAIEKAGGLEIYSGPIPFKATDLIVKQDPPYKKDLYDYQSTKYKQFVIKTPAAHIWIELNYSNNANLVDFTVLTEEGLK